MNQQEMEMPSKVAHVGAMLEKLGTSKYVSTARATNFRCPEHVLSEVDAMAELAGKSRNAMLVYLIEAAIEEVRSTLDDTTIYRLNEATMARLTAYQANDAERVQFSDEE
jgi:uncharacterized protein (DUF1778 family)